MYAPDIHLRGSPKTYLESSLKNLCHANLQNKPAHISSRGIQLNSSPVVLLLPLYTASLSRDTRVRREVRSEMYARSIINIVRRPRFGRGYPNV